MRTTGVMTTVLVVTVLLSMNAAPVASASDALFPVSVENCGIATTCTEAPRRAFAMNQSATETMLALGPQDRIIGTAFLDDTILPQCADAYKAIPVRSAACPSRGVLFKAQPDFVYAAYPSAFSSELSGMEDLLHSGTDSLTFSDATPGIRNIAAVRKVAEAFYPERFSTGLARHAFFR